MFSVSIAVVVLTACRLWGSRAAASHVLHRVRQGDGPTASWVLISLTGVLAVLGWIVFFTEVDGVVARLAYMVWPCWLGMIGVAVCLVQSMVPKMSRWVPLVIILFVLLALNAWVLHSATSIHHAVYRIQL